MPRINAMRLAAKTKAAAKLVQIRCRSNRDDARLSLTNRPTLVYTDVKISATQNATKHSFAGCAVAFDAVLSRDALCRKNDTDEEPLTYIKLSPV